VTEQCVRSTVDDEVADTISPNLAAAAIVGFEQGHPQPGDAQVMCRAQARNASSHDHDIDVVPAGAFHVCTGTVPGRETAPT
jgi:hypothetical protein